MNWEASAYYVNQDWFLKNYYGYLLDLMGNILENLQTQELFQSCGNHNNHSHPDYHNYSDNWLSWKVEYRQGVDTESL